MTVKRPLVNYSGAIQELSATDILPVDKIAEIIASKSHTVVDIFIYDTSKDSDGGAWRKRCSHLSWYNETLNTATRGATREFPAVALIVAESNKVTIYDATDPDCPMWMVFESGGTYGSSTAKMIGGTGIALTSCYVANGELVLTDSNIQPAAVNRINFIKDNSTYYNTSGSAIIPHDISGRNIGDTSSPSYSGAGIVSSICNNVAITVLPDAPTDQATGLPVPTIAVATDGGVSVIDGPAGVGTVVDITWSSSTLCTSINIVSNSGFIVSHGSTASLSPYLHVFNDLPAADVSEGLGYLKGTADAFYSSLEYSTFADLDILTASGTDAVYTCGNALGGLAGLTLLKENPQTPAEGMVAYITKDYNSGWMRGDIKGAWLADTTAETIGDDIVTEHVTNGTFDTDTDWTKGTGWTISGGTASSDGSQTANSSLTTSTIPSTVAGEVYIVSFEVTAYTAGNVALKLDGVEVIPDKAATGTYTATYKASDTTGTIDIVADLDFVGSVDNVSLKKVQNLVENGEFSSDRAWTKGTGWTIASGVASSDGSQGGISNLNQTTSKTLGVGEKILIEFEVTAVSAGSVNVRMGATNGTLRTSIGIYTEVITGSVSSAILYMQASADFVGSIDNITLYELDVPDRSVNDNPLRVVGELEKTTVATGAELVAYSGFSTDNYLEQPYNSDLDVGTGSFNELCWLTMSANTAVEVIFERDSATSAQRITAQVNADGTVSFICDDNTTVRTATSTRAIDDGNEHLLEFEYSDGTLNIKIDGVLDGTATGAALLTLSNADAVFRIGLDVQGVNPLTHGSLVFVRFELGLPSAEQIKHIYDTEKHLFVEDTDCTLAGTSDSILALDFDDITKQPHAMTSYGRSTFQGLRMVESEATAVGTPSAVSATGGCLAQGGSTAAKIYIPEIILRDELARQEETGNPLGLELFWFTGDGAETDFILPIGWKPKFVYDAGLLQKEGASADYEVEFDGFLYTVSFGTAPTNLNDIGIMSVRS